MENSRLLFAFDKKSMKGAFYVPFFMWGVALLGILFYASMEKDYYNHFIIVQGIFLPFCCWHLVYRYSELLVHGAEDTLFPYYRKWFFYDIARYGILYSLLLIVLLLIIGIKGGAAVFDSITLTHLPILLLFYLFGGLALLFVMKSVEVTLAILFIYTVIEVVTLGKSGLPWPQIFIFLPPLPEDPEMTKKFTFLLLITVSMAMYVAKKVRLF